MRKQSSRFIRFLCTSFASLVLVVAAIAYGNLVIAGRSPQVLSTAKSPDAAKHNWSGMAPLASLLNADGTVNQSSSVEGRFNVAGWRMQLSVDGAPMFVQAASDDERWASSFGSHGVKYGTFDGKINAIAQSGDNLYIGGTFASVGNVPAHNIARYNRVEGKWYALGVPGRFNDALGAGVNGAVQAIVINGNNVFIGGNFTSVYNADGVIVASRVARWDGSRWNTLGAGSGVGEGVNAGVLALAVNGNDLYVGGVFTEARTNASTTVMVNSVARWNGSAWSALGGSDRSGNGVLHEGGTATVYALALLGSDLYVGGRFTNALTASTNLRANSIARWNGSVWSALGGGAGNTQFGTRGDVFALVTNGTDLFAGGSFQSMNNADSSNVASARYVARWNGSVWSGLAGGVNAPVRSLLSLGGDLYIGGEFGSAFTDANALQSITAGRIARWNNTSWSALGNDSPNGLNGTVYALGSNGTDLIVGGEFIEAGISASDRVRTGPLAVWRGTSWGHFSTRDDYLGNGVDGYVTAVVTSGDDVYVAGAFSRVGGVAASNIARWNQVTKTWSVLGSSTQNGVNGRVSALAISGGELYVGGNFSQARNSATDTVSVINIARWNVARSVWSSLGATGSGVDGSVSAIAMVGDDVYVGGTFTSASNGGVSIGTSHLARWAPHTGLWTPLGGSTTASGNGVNREVNALLVNGNDLYVGGFFTRAYNRAGSEVNTSYVARWNLLTNEWAALAGGVSSVVRAFAVGGETLFVAGAFTSATNGPGQIINSPGIVRWNLLTNSWTAMGGNADLNRQINVLITQGSEVYAGGAFTAYRDATAGKDIPGVYGLARWDGTGWRPLGSGLSGYFANISYFPVAQSLALTNGRLFVGGQFDTAGLQSSVGFASYVTDGITITANDTASANSTAQVSAKVFNNGNPVSEGTVTFSVRNGASVVGNPVSVSVNNGTAAANLTVSAGTPSGNYRLLASYQRTGSEPVFQTSANLFLRLSSNTPPSITAATPASVPQGSVAAAGTTFPVATVNDAQSNPASLQVVATSVPAGLTINNISNENGSITASVTTTCAIATGTKNVVFTVTDGVTSATANFTVNVTANTPPVLGNYANSTVAVGNTIQVTPDAVPRDNSSVTSVAVTGVPGASVNAVTGVVTIFRPGTAGTYPVTVTATDDCGATSKQAFTLAVNTTVPALEGDISPRPNGEGVVMKSDWEQAGRFVVRLDMPEEGGEFQRLDAAPRAVFGDGRISLADWVQIGRYAAGLDGAPTAAGPVAAVTAPGLAVTSEMDLPRALYSRNAIFTRGQVGTLFIDLDATGNENALAFSLSFDPKQLIFLDAVPGTGAVGASLQVNSSQAGTGRLGFGLALPAGQQFAAGTRNVVSLRFIPNGGEGDTTTTMSFSDQLLPREVVDATAIAINTIEYRSGTVSLTGRAAAHVSAAHYLGGDLTADAIVSAFGTNLATVTAKATTLSLPTTLGGTVVRLRDAAGVERNAPLFFVSPDQVNYQIPAGVAEGIATVTITNGAGATTIGLLNISRIAPGIFSADMTGSGYAAADVTIVGAGGEQVITPAARFDAAQNKIVPNPIDLSLGATWLSLYGTGIRQRTRLSEVIVKVGGAEMIVDYAGDQRVFVGLDQINVRLPSSLAGRGEVLIEVIVEGKAANPVRVFFR